MLELDGVQEFDAARGDGAPFSAHFPPARAFFLLKWPIRARNLISRARPISGAPRSAFYSAPVTLQAAEFARSRCADSLSRDRIQIRTGRRRIISRLARTFLGDIANLVRVRPPAMLKVNLRNEYPRCYVTRSIRPDGGFYFGPFASRKAAQSFSEEFLDLFKIRRCQIKIRPDPGFPGCMYSQMKMCLAPCFAGCTKQEYEAEVGRVLKGLETGGAQLIQDIEREREAASEALDFERASALHKRLEKISAVLRGLPELTRRRRSARCGVLQRAAGEKTVAAFPVRGGLLSEPIFLRFGEIIERTQISRSNSARRTHLTEDDLELAGKTTPLSGENELAIHSPRDRTWVAVARRNARTHGTPVSPDPLVLLQPPGGRNLLP